MSSWIFEPGHTEAQFRARHMMVTWVSGLFKDVHGEMELDLDEPLGTTFRGEMDATRIWTGEEDRTPTCAARTSSTSRTTRRPRSRGASWSAPATRPSRAPPT